MSGRRDTTAGADADAPGAAAPGAAARSKSAVAPDARTPLWPGWSVAALCGVVYLLVGSGGTLRVRASSFTHHNLTAQAWLKGRFFVTAEEIEGQHLLVRSRIAGRPFPAETGPDDARRTARASLEAKARSEAGGRPVHPAAVDAHYARLVAPAFHDWVRLDGRYYAYWPPLPAALMLPFVAAFGPTASDIFVANLIGAATVFFVFLALAALRRHWTELTVPACAGLALLYGLGTCHFYQAGVGQVWYLTQLSGTLFLAIAAWLGLAALRSDAGRLDLPRFLLAGAALGLGFLGRNTIILAAPMFAVMLYLAVRDARRWPVRYLLCGAAFAAVLAAAVAVQLAFNKARFGDPLDFGQGRLADAGGNPRFAAEFKQYGRFHPHYLGRNLYYYFLNPALRRYPKTDALTFDPMGNSVFLVSPALIYLLAPAGRAAIRLLGRARGRRDDSNRQRPRPVSPAVEQFLNLQRFGPGRLAWAVWAGALPPILALMFFHGTGWYQFGHRYLLDAMPLLVLLAAFGMRGRLTLVSIPLILLSVAVNAWGTYRFCQEQF